MICGKNQLELGDRGSYFFAAPILVVFFGVCIIFQIALIKLVGGFFNAKQTRDVLIVDRGIEVAANYWNLIRPIPALSASSNSQAVDFPKTSILIFPVIFFALILVFRGQFTPPGLYKSDHIRIRPPLTFRRCVNY